MDKSIWKGINKIWSWTCNPWLNERVKDTKKVYPHIFRHSFAVHCLKKGMNLRSLQKILGHSSLTTTQIYLDVIGEDVKEDFEKVEW